MSDDKKDDKQTKEEKTMGFQFTLAKAAKNKGKTLYALAKETNRKASALSVMNRPGYDPKLSTVAEFAHVLQCPVTDLIELNGKTEPKTTAPAKKAAAKKPTPKKPTKKAKK